MLKKISPLLLLCSFGLAAAPLRLAPVANDDYASVTVGVRPSVSINLSTNDRYGSMYYINGTTYGEHGFLELASGATVPSSNPAFGALYTYTLYENAANAALAAGQVVTDTFTYTYANDIGQSATARIIIQVTGNQQVPVAVDDFASVVVGTSPVASGNLSANDRNGNIVSINGSTTGRYGFLQLFGNSGAYTYTLYDNDTNAKLAPGQNETDTFSYTYTNDLGQSATARLTVQVTGSSQTPIAIDDSVTLVPTNTIFTVSGNVTSNDSNGVSVYLNSDSHPAGEFGNLVLNPDGTFIYTLNKDAPNVIALTAGEIKNDLFSYIYIDQLGKTATATLTVTIVGNPVDGNGNTIYPIPEGTLLDNVDVEFNNRSADATPLNSGRNIRGSLYDSEDKDWFFLTSKGDEIIRLELCPQGSSCFDKKSWVVYVFDSAKLTLAMEEDEYEFRRWIDETGGVNDLLGNNRLGTGIVGSSNHMYLAYQRRAFEGALLGVIDPCFDNLNTLEIGVGSGERNYYIAVSSTLMGSDGGEPAGQCGVGTVVLRRPGFSVAGSDAEGKAKTFTTTEEYISAFPFSDDQYSIKITGTGDNPLLSTTTAGNAATFDTRSGAVNIPKLRIANTLYSADLTLQPVASTGRSANSNGALKFALSGIQELGPEGAIDAFRATYNQLNQRLLIPRVTDTVNGNAYSVIMQYHKETDGEPAWLEVIDYVLIQ